MINATEFQRVRSILLREWDPIGTTQMRDYNEATDDEYDRYAHEIVAKLVRGASVEDVFAYLKWASTENMGLSIFQEDKAKRAAKLIAQAV